MARGLRRGEVMTPRRRTNTDRGCLLFLQRPLAYHTIKLASRGDEFESARPLKMTDDGRKRPRVQQFCRVCHLTEHRAEREVVCDRCWSSREVSREVERPADAPSAGGCEVPNGTAARCYLGRARADDELYSKPAHAMPLANARQRPGSKKENQAGHSPERVAGGL